jgi:beta-lactam-binding protein with PASTA domain
MKKIIVLLTPVATVLAIAFAPASGSADTITSCPPGTTDPHYCSQKVKCVVPSLTGKTVKQAKVLLREHDCKLGKVHKPKSHHKKHKKHHKGKHHATRATASRLTASAAHHKKKHEKKHVEHIVRQNPKAGSVLPQGTKVDVWVR